MAGSGLMLTPPSGVVGRLVGTHRPLAAGSVSGEPVGIHRLACSCAGIMRPGVCGGSALGIWPGIYGPNGGLESRRIASMARTLPPAQTAEPLGEKMQCKYVKT